MIIFGSETVGCKRISYFFSRVLRILVGYWKGATESYSLFGRQNEIKKDVEFF